MKERIQLIKPFLYLALLLVILLLLVGAICDYIAHPVKQSITLEASTNTIDVQALLKRETNAKIIKNLTKKQRKTVGEYPVVVKYKDNDYTCLVSIKDTTAPVVKVKDLSGYTKHNFEPKDFIEDVKDMSATITTFKKKDYDFNKEGKQTLILVTRDPYKNKTETAVTLTLKEDKTPPVLKGVKDLNLYIGKTVSYKKHVEAIDDVDGKLSIDVDSSKVNVEKKGTYKVTYSVTDLSGNKTSKTVNAVVKDYDLYAEMDELCEKTIDKIIKPNMNTEQKIKAIYQYCVNHIRVTGYHYGSIDDYKRAGYYGFKQQSGDCTTYAGMFMSLLEEADITDFKIVRRYPINILNHYWLLINTGHGYYHYDPYRLTYKVTDAQLDEIGSHNPKFNYYQRQRDLYPATPLS